MKPQKLKSQNKKSSGKPGAAKVQPKADRKPRAAHAKSEVPKPTSKSSDIRTKHDVILNLLRREMGAAIDDLAKATDWQPHSVRGFLAGVVRKKLGLNLVSEKVDGIRRYRIGK